MEAPRISPDGTHLAYIATIRGERALAIRDLKGGRRTPVMKLTSGTYSGTHCDFKNDNRLLCHFRGLESSFGEHSYPSSRLVAIDRDGNHLKVLSQTRFAGSAVDNNPQFQDRIVHFLPDDPKHVLIEMTDGTAYFPAVWELDIDSGTRHAVVSAHAPVLHWIADRDGVVRFGYGYHDQRYGFRDTSAVYIARNGAKDPWRTRGEVQALRGRALRTAGLWSAAKPAVRQRAAAETRRRMADGP